MYDGISEVSWRHFIFFPILLTFIFISLIMQTMDSLHGRPIKKLSSLPVKYVSYQGPVEAILNMNLVIYESVNCMWPGQRTRASH